MLSNAAQRLSARLAPHLISPSITARFFSSSGDGYACPAFYAGQRGSDENSQARAGSPSPFQGSGQVPRWPGALGQLCTTIIILHEKKQPGINHFHRSRDRAAASLG